MYSHCIREVFTVENLSDTSGPEVSFFFSRSPTNSKSPTTTNPGVSVGKEAGAGDGETTAAGPSSCARGGSDERSVPCSTRYNTAEKMAKRVADVRKESDERQAAMCLARMQVPSIPVDTQDDTGVDQGAEDEIWEVTDGPAEEYEETQGEGDAVAALLELAQWELVE